MFSTDKRNGTIGTATVASFGYFEESVVSRSANVAMIGKGEKIFRLFGCLVGTSDSLNQLFPFMNSEKGIDFGHFFTEVIAIAFDEASHSKESAATSVVCMTTIEVLFCFNLFKKHVDRFLLGIAYEATSVDDDNVAIVATAIEMHLMSGRGKVTCDIFTVDSVLTTTESDNIYFHLKRFSDSECLNI